jgi:C1q-related factor
VAFFAGLSENMGPVTENSDVKFDRLVTNAGGGFNTTSGRFTAPVDGVYQFNVVISAQGRQKVITLQGV